MSSTLPSTTQLIDFLAVADSGGFSAAARALGRAQPAVTYSVQELEAGLGVLLFERGRRPLKLTAEGAALMSIARRAIREITMLQQSAERQRQGVEAELSVVVDFMFPMQRILSVATELKSSFPSVNLQIAVESLGSAIESLLEKRCVLAITGPMVADVAELARIPILTIRRVPVVSAEHPLARIKGEISADVLADHVQILLTDRSPLTRQRNFGIVSRSVWRTSDLGARHAMILSGLGWGSLPLHQVQRDLDDGRLVELNIRVTEAGPWISPLQLYIAWRKDVVLGPAASWMLDRLQAEQSSPAER